LKDQPDNDAAIANTTLRRGVRAGNDSAVSYTRRNQRQQYSEELAIGHGAHLDNINPNVLPSSVTAG
jgi:hypothetical protein